MDPLRVVPRIGKQPFRSYDGPRLGQQFRRLRTVMGRLKVHQNNLYGVDLNEEANRATRVRLVSEEDQSASSVRQPSTTARFVPQSRAEKVPFLRLYANPAR